MNTKIGIRRFAAGLALALLPAVAFAHEIVPWGDYPAAGDVTISTKSKRLFDRTFIDVLSVGLGPGITGYQVGMGANVPALYGIVDFTNRKGTKAKLTVEPDALLPWAAQMKSLVRQYREAKGDVVEDVDAELRVAGGAATFKTTPTPVGPLHKATVTVTIKWKVTVTLAGGVSKKGIVVMAVRSKGVRPGIPGGD